MSLSHFSKLFLAAALVAPLALRCQPDINNLSADERIELAQEETQQASLDEKFLELMDSADVYFKNGRLDKSLNAYQKAKRRRPNNVYPPVKIQDVKLAMKDSSNWNRKPEKEDKEEEMKDNSLSSSIPDFQSPDKERWEKDEKARKEKVDEWEEDVRNQRQLEREKEENDDLHLDDKKGSDVAHINLEDYRKELARRYPQGVTETRYKKGNRQITKRVVVREDKGDTYKRVEHSWGGVFYFKNSNPITEETWKRETSKQ